MVASQVSDVVRAPARLDYTPEVARATASIFERVRRVIPEIEWPVHAPYIAAINELKRERNAIILAHNYQTPEIFHGVADLAGDSLALARQAARTDAEVIVLCGVHFMAETAKLLCPEKTVVIPDLEAGCSLASSIAAADVRVLRRRYPGVPVVSYVNTSAAVKAESDICCTSANAVAMWRPRNSSGRNITRSLFSDSTTATALAEVQQISDSAFTAAVVSYVNTSAAVKAESDICCTSANAVEVVESLNSDRVIFLPDEFLGRHIAGQTNVDVILWTGHCEVHERFSAADVRLYREQYQDVQVLAHPECPPEVLAEADFVGSTSGMIRYVGQRRPTRVVMITECSMSDNVAVEFPQTEFIRPCNLCPHMKRITLPKILRTLETLQYPVLIEPAVAENARRAVERMLHVAERPAQ